MRADGQIGRLVPPIGRIWGRRKGPGLALIASAVSINHLSARPRATCSLGPHCKPSRRLTLLVAWLKVAKSRQMGCRRLAKTLPSFKPLPGQRAARSEETKEAAKNHKDKLEFHGPFLRVSWARRSDIKFQSSGSPSRLLSRLRRRRACEGFRAAAQKSIGNLSSSEAAAPAVRFWSLEEDLTRTRPK